MKFNIESVVLVLLLVLFVPLSSFAKTFEHQLPNGLKIVVKTDDRAPVLTSQLWYRVGSLDEVNGLTGLSHLLEHMMFKGTKKVPSGKFSHLIAAAGGENNAFTSYNYTAYYENLAADKLDLALRLEADRMTQLNFSDKEFKSELEVVKEERRWRTEDQPTGTLTEQLYASAFIANPVRVPVIGWMDDLNHMQPNDLRRWYHTWYVPNNATLVVVGNVKPQEVFREAEKYFAALPKRVLPERRAQNEPEQKGIRRIQVKAVSELPFLVMAYKAPKLDLHLQNRTAFALFMLSAVLDGQDASRLPRRLVREKHLATSIDCNYNFMGRGGALFMLSGIPANGVSVVDLEKALRVQIKDIADKGVTQEELNRITHQIAASRIYSQDSIGAQASQIGALESIGFSWRDEEKIEQTLASISPLEVKSAAKTLIDDNLTVAVLVPQKPAKNAQPRAPMSIGGGDVR